MNLNCPLWNRFRPDWFVRLFQIKFCTLIHAFLSDFYETALWSESGEKSAQIKQRLQAKKTAFINIWLDFWCERQQEMDFFTGGRVIMDWYFCWKQWFEVKNIVMLDVFQLLSSPDVNWCGVDYCDVFISSHSDGTHSLQSIRCWDIDAMPHFSKSDEEKLILDGQR